MYAFHVTTPTNRRPFLSIVIPCFNERDVLPILFERLTQIMSTLPADSEVILVDDGSKDGTRHMITAFSQKDPRFRAVILSRNYGHQLALTAGLDQAQGDVVAVLDSDLQDPPELIAPMLAKWQEGYAVVYGKRKRRDGETWAKKTTAAMFYWLIRHLSGVDIPDNVGDFRLMDRKVVDALKAMPERFRFTRGLVVYAGFSQCAFPYDRPPRAAGTTKYPWRRMFSFAFDAIFSFSTVPLRISTIVGAGVVLVAAVLIVRTLYERLILHTTVPGFSAIYVLMLTLGGINLVILGILGEYIGRIYVEAKGRPLYFVDSVTPPIKSRSHV